ncbi:MAG: SDR family NAD(P)-dependent oxidoreductase, partial [Dehalococcoidia bacterium]
MKDVERTGKHMSADWTTDNILELADRIIIVTGANSGLGYEAAKEFARRGARTILACRDMDRAQSALARIRTEIPDAPAEIMQLNLASLKSVHRFAEAFVSKYDHLDVLLNNAGVMFVP